MPGQALGWIGRIVAARAAGAYFAVVGSDKAHKVPSMISTFAGLVGPGLAAYGAMIAKVSAHDPEPWGDGVYNEISGGTQCGNVFQGRDFCGPITGLAPKPLHSGDAPP